MFGGGTTVEDNDEDEILKWGLGLENIREEKTRVIENLGFFNIGVLYRPKINSQKKNSNQTQFFGEYKVQTYNFSHHITMTNI